MSNQYYRRLILYCFILSVLFIAGSAKIKAHQMIGTGYWVPQTPPNVHYTIKCSIDLTKGVLEGTENIRFKNTTQKPIHRLQIKWDSLGSMEITCKGETVTEIKGQSDNTFILIELAEPLSPGKETKLQIKFQISAPEYAGVEKIPLTGWYPCLWWGFETHSDFDVKVETTPEYTLATSGVFDSKSGFYRAEKVRSFGLFLGKNYNIVKARAKDVLVQVLFTPKGEECARLLLDTAVDVINFYRERFGFYPYSILTIVPGMNRPAGGYPIATGIVAIHGMEQFDSKPKLHWQWITAHEIGHQYWGEHVMEKDTPGWLWIGLGIYADREYVRARKLGLEEHRRLMRRYIEGVRAGLDTTVSRSEKQRSNIKFDFNNVVIHGKGYSIISALDCTLGSEMFDRIYKRCLKEFGGRRLGAHELRQVCEQEAGQDLGWFFEQWLNSNRYLSYEISSKTCEKKSDQFISKVVVKCLGNLKMPVPVTAYFEDGRSQSRFTDRLLKINTLEFRSDSPLKEVCLDPENVLALVVPPPSSDSKAFEIASKSQTEVVTQIFQQMQGYVRDERYQEAWELLSKDFQREGFLNSFETFVGMVSSAKEKFLALEPYSTGFKDGVLTLTTTSKDLALIIDFIQIEDQWKIKCMASSPGDWLKQLLLKMEKRSTEHFDIYYFKDSTAEKDINKIAVNKEHGFNEICKFLGIQSDERICLVFFEDQETKFRETGHQGMGMAEGNTNVEVYNEKERLDPYHETAHVLIEASGKPPSLFYEGFAVYMAERLGAYALKNLGGGELSLYERVRELRTKGDWIPLEELITYTDIGPSWSRPPVSYAEAAEFVKFLIDTYGKDKFLQAYKGLKNSSDKSVQQQNKKILSQIYGLSIADLESKWVAAFSEQDE